MIKEIPMGIVRCIVSVMDGFVDFVVGPRIFKKNEWNNDPVVNKESGYSRFPPRPAFDPNVKEITLSIEKYTNGIYMTNVRKAARDAGFDHFIMVDAVSRKPIWETELPYMNNMCVEKYITDSKNIVSDESVGIEV